MDGRRELDLCWECASPFFTAVMCRHGMPIARAHLFVEDGKAVLQDIIVYPRVPVRAWLPLWMGRLRTRSFRREGIGTDLLAAVLERAEREGAIVIEGLITDPAPWLIAWYVRHGFSYDVKSSTIHRQIAAARG